MSTVESSLADFAVSLAEAFAFPPCVRDVLAQVFGMSIGYTRGERGFVVVRLFSALK